MLDSCICVTGSLDLVNNLALFRNRILIPSENNSLYLEIKRQIFSYLRKYFSLLGLILFIKYQTSQR